MFSNTFQRIVFAPLFPVIVAVVAVIALGILARHLFRNSHLNPDERILCFMGLILGTILLFAGAVYMFNRLNMVRANRAAGVREALNMAKTLESALKNFESEYGVCPDVGAHIKTDSAEGARLLAILLGNEGSSGPVLNKRGIRFLGIREARHRLGGLVYNSGTHLQPEALVDRWGNPYDIVINTSHTDELCMDFAGKSISLKGRRFAIFSPGKDKVLGTADDVKTW